MKILIAISVSTFTVGLVVMVIVIVNRQFDYVNHLTDQRITAKQFFALYSIAPEKWSFDEYLLRATYKREIVHPNAIYDCASRSYGPAVYTSNEEISFTTYLGALRVREFFRNKEEKKRNARAIKHRAELIKAWSKDVEEFCGKGFLPEDVTKAVQKL